MLANPDAGLTRTQAAQLLGPDVSPHTVNMWATRGWVDANGTRRHVRVVGRQGRSRLYRYADLLQAEADTRNNPNSPRNPNRAA